MRSCGGVYYCLIWEDFPLEAKVALPLNTWLTHKLFICLMTTILLWMNNTGRARFIKRASVVWRFCIALFERKYDVNRCLFSKALIYRKWLWREGKVYLYVVRLHNNKWNCLLVSKIIKSWKVGFYWQVKYKLWKLKPDGVKYLCLNMWHESFYKHFCYYKTNLAVKRYAVYTFLSE